MSEEVLKALMQFFAIINKQSDGEVRFDIKYVEQFLRSHVSQQYLEEYLEIYRKRAKKKKSKNGETVSRTSVTDSVRVLGICKKINKTLDREKKIIVLVRLLEFLKSAGLVNVNALEILFTATDVFKISLEDYEASKQLILEDDSLKLDSDLICIITQRDNEEVGKTKRIDVENLDGHIRIGNIGGLNSFFLYYQGRDHIYLNGLPVTPFQVYVLKGGSILKLGKTGQIYYSQIADVIQGKSELNNLTFKVENLNYHFPNGKQGLHDINLGLRGGNLVAFMGASGAGKSTLLTTLTGLSEPSTGTVKINGIDVHKDYEELEGVIGFIPQDDLLLGDLTVYENLYYSAKLCFDNLKPKELEEKVNESLKALGLYEIRHIKVGSPLVKRISGGQRKRLNIALELIREPSILFVDEPTSGLSSGDSERIMHLLKEQAQGGKIVFVVIHQPSSDIFKMFDQLLILDVGGFPVYYGNPVESLIYFKSKTNQVNSEVGECINCGNVNTELVFNLIESKVVNEKGEYLEDRIIGPEKWNQLYKEEREIRKIEFTESNEKADGELSRPSWFGQVSIYFKRDFKSKLANLNYVLINILEAPVLAFIISYLIRYTDPEVGIYHFSLNKNIPAFLFICVIVALFMGLTLSAEEILKDRKILKREAFLNLSWSAYLTSKIVLLFGITFFQTFCFVMVGKFILQFHDLYVEHWLILISLGCAAVLVGLLVSSLFDRAVTVYILIPVLLIPQMVLSGAIFHFDELNEMFGSEENVPIIADMMVARWAYEALMVSSFTDNKFEKNYYYIDQLINEENYLQLYYLPKVEELIGKVALHEKDSSESLATLENEVAGGMIQKDEISSEISRVKEVLHHEIRDNHLMNKDLAKHIVTRDYQALIRDMEDARLEIKNILNELEEVHENITDSLLEALGSSEAYKELIYNHHNKYVENVVRNKFQIKELIVSDEMIIRKKDWIFEKPHNYGISYRTHLYAPVKKVFSLEMKTLWFNILAIWFLNLIVFITLKTNLLPRLKSKFGTG